MGVQGHNAEALQGCSVFGHRFPLIRRLKISRMPLRRRPVRQRVDARRRRRNSSQQPARGRFVARRFRASCFAGSRGSVAGT